VASVRRPGGDDRGRAEPERLGDPPCRRPQRPLGVLPEQQLPGHGRRQVGLAAALLGLNGARARELGDGRDDERDDDERDERDPVALGGDREPAGGRQLKEVEGGRAEQCAEQAQQRTPVDRDEQHRRQVDDAQRVDRRDALER
jgi:hypothetical protein